METDGKSNVHRQDKKWVGIFDEKLDEETGVDVTHTVKELLPTLRRLSYTYSRLGYINMKNCTGHGRSRIRMSAIWRTERSIGFQEKKNPEGSLKLRINNSIFTKWYIMISTFIFNFGNRHYYILFTSNTEGQRYGGEHFCGLRFRMLWPVLHITYPGSFGGQ